MRFSARALVYLIFSLLLAACQAESFARPTLDLSTATLTVTPSPTATIDWFPATATATLRPSFTQAPTLDLRPPLGDVIFKDPFRDTSAWPTFRVALGSAGYGNEELTLAMQKTDGIISTLRKDPVITDFYVEVTAETSLCRGDDSFGLLFRGASEWNAYRFAVTCEGLLRVERVRGGQLLPLTDWTVSDQILPTGGLPIRIGVLAAGPELRFYINGAHQISVRDPIFTSGQIGLFARSNGETALTVNFSDMQAWQVDPATLPVTPTPTTYVKPTATRLPTQP